jgi:hypothetical protein
MPEPNGLGMKVVWAAVILAVVGGIGLLLHQPWLFPSLGPTAMLMLESPEQPSARFVNAIVGHVVAVVVGLAALVACGLYGQPSAPTAGLSVRYVVAGVVCPSRSPCWCSESCTARIPRPARPRSS